MYNNKAHTILGAVIASHGGQLLTSNAFCKVYLTGYLVDYPEEKKILIALKLKELPEVLLDYSNAEVTDSTLFDAIRKVTRVSHEEIDAVAWGVDAWAAAAGLSDTMRQTVRQQCFPEVSAEINIDRSILQTSELPQKVPPESPVVTPITVPARQSRIGFGAKLLATAVGVSGLIVFQVFGGNAPKPFNTTKPVKMPMMIPGQMTSAIEVVKPSDVLVKDTAPLSAESLKVSKKVIKPVPKIVQSVPTVSQSASKIAQSAPKVAQPVPKAIASAPTSTPAPALAPEKLVPNLTPRLLVSNPTSPIVNVKKPAYKVVQIDKSQENKPELKAKAKTLSVTSLEYEQKSQRLNADVEAFLKYGN